MPPSPVEELALLDLDRSNKGASKQRRDQINAEIAIMRDLLPLPETARQRLSQLQIMSLSCVYIRKCNVLQKLFRSISTEKDVLPATCDFFQALTGFLLITTREGKLVYISENVTDYLGHSMVDMKTQGDSLYDIVDKRDHGTVQAQLLAGGADLDVTRDVAFFCRMNMSRTLKRQAGFGDVKVMHVRGHFIPLSDPDMDGREQQQQPHQQQYVFMATCSPLITPELKENLIQSNTMVFKTVHQLDMTFMEVTKTAEYHLGCSTEEICHKSWYSMLHPEDIHEARDKHIMLIRSSHEMGCMMTVRMLTSEGLTLWVNVVMHVRQASSTQNDEPLIVCINQVISEEEAYQIRMQSHMFTLYPPRAGELWAAGLSGTHTSTQPQPDTTTRWMPPTPTAMVPPAQTATYQATPYYSQQRLPQPPASQGPSCTNAYPLMHGRSGYIHSSSSSPPTSLPAPPAQTDKLKLMLKRKIQGPCRPAKVPKLIWDDGLDGQGHNGQMEYAATGDPMHSPDSASQLVSAGGHSGGLYSWPAPAQVIPRAQYRVMPVLMPQPTNIKASLMASALSPPLSAPYTKEQVVPEGSVALPESYLTPDPSPATSPHPHIVKTEPLEHKSAPSSVAILQKLEKLASFSPATDKVTTSDAAATITIKQEKNLTAPACRQTSRQKDLPVMNAFDIESFFDTLGCEELLSAAAAATSDLHPKKQLDGTASEPNTARVIKADALPQMAIIKQEPVDTFVTSNQREQKQERTPAALSSPAKLNQSDVDPGELEDLLSFFSGEMTATQLDLNDTLLSSTATKDEGDMLVDSVKAFADGLRQDPLPCGAGHLGHFLFHNTSFERPLEEFSPVSSSDNGSDLGSDMSGDEENEESMKGLLVAQSKPQGADRHSPVPSLSPSLHPTHPQTPQDVPGICEEDELYQLDKLLLSMASNNGIMVSEEAQ